MMVIAGPDTPDDVIQRSKRTGDGSSKLEFDFFKLGAVAFAIFLVLVVIIGTPWGLGLSPDSVGYAGGARAVAEHGDFMQLPTGFAPLYPMLLAFAQLLASDFYLGARLLQAMFMGLNIILIATLLKKTERPRVIIAALLILIALQPSFISVHFMLWSEPAFLSFALFDLVILENMCRRGASRGLLLLLGLTAGAAIMVRYAGMFLVAVNILALLFLDRSKRSAAARMLNAVWASVVAIIPISGWALFNIVRSGNPVNRVLEWHPLDEQHLEQAVITIDRWFHLSITPGLAVVSISAIAVWVLRANKSEPGSESRSLARLLAIYYFAYLTFLALSISLMDFSILLKERILFPLMPVIPIFLVSATTGITKYHLPLLVVGAVITGLALNVPESYNFWRESRVNGIGFANKQIQSMPITSTLRQMPEQMRISTNGMEIFQLYLKQKAVPLPYRFDPARQQFNSDYTAELQRLPIETDAVVYFSLITWRGYFPDRGELSGIKGLRKIYDQPDGAIWVRAQ
jgi:4-amino-4-deoxy-L-arabinose transferase-like glycosyltransferase